MFKGQLRHCKQHINFLEELFDYINRIILKYFGLKYSIIVKILFYKFLKFYNH